MPDKEPASQNIWGLMDRHEVEWSDQIEATQLYFTLVSSKLSGLQAASTQEQDWQLPDTYQ